EEIVDGMFPRQVFLDSPTPELTHPRSLLGMIQQPEYLVREISHMINPIAVQRCFLGAEPALRSFELHDGLAQCHVFHNLDHGRKTIHLAGLVWINTHLCSRENLNKLCVGNISSK